MIAVLAQLIEARRKARRGSLPVAAFPVQPAYFAIQATGARTISHRLDFLPYRLVMRESLCTPVGERQEVRKSLADRLHQVIATLAAGEGTQSAIVMANGIIIGIHSARPVSGRHQIAGAFGLIRSQAPVMPQRFEIAQSRRVGTDTALKRPRRPLMQLTPAREEQVSYTTSCTSACLNRYREPSGPRPSA